MTHGVRHRAAKDEGTYVITEELGTFSKPLKTLLSMYNVSLPYIKANLLYKAEMMSVCLLAVTPVTRSSLHGLTWDFAYVELWSLARECMFKHRYTTLNRDWKRITRANTFLCKNMSL